MKNFQTEALKPKVWIDTGIMISLEADASISALLYKRGFFKPWKVVNQKSSEEDLHFVRKKIIDSFDKSIRIMGSISRHLAGDIYKKQALEILQRNSKEFAAEVKMAKLREEAELYKIKLELEEAVKSFIPIFKKLIDNLFTGLTCVIINSTVLKIFSKKIPQTYILVGHHQKKVDGMFVFDSEVSTFEFKDGQNASNSNVYSFEYDTTKEFVDEMVNYISLYLKTKANEDILEAALILMEEE